MGCDLDQEVLGIAENHAYVAAVVGDSTAQMFLVAERTVLGAVNNAVGTVFGLIATYFVFNMVYPKQLY